MRISSAFVILLLTLCGAAASVSSDGTGPRFVELRRFTAPEARQGVAADADHLYAIGNHHLGRYRKNTGVRVAQWECVEGEPLIHLNAGVVRDGLLHCAHSNFPGVPHRGSIESWEAETLRHVGSLDLGETDGSLVWIDRRGDRWLACFAHYGRRGGAPGRGPAHTRLVELDDTGRETARWDFPADLLEHVGTRGYSLSGGALGPRGHLYVTGHDEPEVYVLAFPAEGRGLTWIGRFAVPAEGQAFAFDPTEPDVLHLILKRTREIISGRVEFFRSP